MTFNLWGDIIKSIFKAVAVLSFFSVITRVLGFIFRIILSRQITTVQLGVYSVAISISSIFITILTAGIPLVVSRKTAEYSVDKDDDKISKTVCAGLTITLFLGLAITLLMLILKPIFNAFLTSKESYSVMITLIPCLIFSGLYAPIRGYLWGKEKYIQVSIVELIEQVLKIICVLILFNVGIKNTNLPAGLSLSIACILSTLVGFWFYKKDKQKIVLPKGFLKSTIKSVAPLNALRIVGSLLQPFISIILPLMLVKVGFSNDQALSMLGIIMGMTFPILTIPTTLVGSLAMALVPKLSVLQKENSISSLQKQIQNSLAFTIFCCFIFLPIFSSLGVPICELLFGNTQAGIYLSHSAWLIVPMGLSQISTAILNSLGKEKFVFFSHGISGVFVVLSILILPKFVGIYALLIGMGLQNTVVALLNIYKISKLTDYSPKLSILLKYVILSFAISLFNQWSYPVMALIFGNLIGLVIITLASTLLFVLLTYSFNIVDLEVLLCRFKKQNKNT